MPRPARDQQSPEQNMKTPPTVKTSQEADDPLMTPTQAADHLNMSAGTLEEWRRRGDSGLRFVQVTARTIRYRRSDLDAFVDARSRG